MTNVNAPGFSKEEQVREQVMAWQRSFMAKDVDSMMSFYAPTGFTAFDLMPPLEFQGGEMWRDNWVRVFASFDGEIELEIADLEIHADGDVAFMRAMVRLAGVMNGTAIDTWVRQTNCFRLIGDAWLMVHDHVSWPTDFATGKSLMDLVPEGARTP